MTDKEKIILINENNKIIKSVINKLFNKYCYSNHTYKECNDNIYLEQHGLHPNFGHIDKSFKEDLYMEAIIILFDVHSRFDANKQLGAKFSTYLYKWLYFKLLNKIIEHKTGESYNKYRYRQRKKKMEDNKEYRNLELIRRKKCTKKYQESLNKGCHNKKPLEEYYIKIGKHDQYIDNQRRIELFRAAKDGGVKLD